MAGRLNVIGDVAVDSDVPTYQRVQVIVRYGTATVSKVGAVLVEKAEVVAVEQPEPRGWLIRFADGTSWAVRAPVLAGRPGCGCG